MIITNIYTNKGGHIKPLPIGSGQIRKIKNFVGGLRRLEAKFFQALQLFYFSKGDRDICQNAALIMSRVLSARFNLPVSNKMSPDEDHIEIAIGIYAAPDLANSFHQTYLIVYLAGQVFYVDPTLPFLMKNDKSISCLHLSGGFPAALKKEVGIESYHPDHEAYQYAGIIAHQYETAAERLEYVQAALELLNDPRVIVEIDGTLFGYNVKEWGRLNRAISFIEPRASLPAFENQASEALAKHGFVASLVLFPEPPAKN